MDSIRFAARAQTRVALAALTVVTALMASKSSAAVYPDIATANATPAATSVTVNNVTISNVLNVSATNGYNLDVQDATGGTQLFRFPTAAFSSFTPAVGQIVNVTATNSPFSSNPEFSNVGAAVTLVSATSTFVPATVTAAVLNAAKGTPLLGETVTLAGVTFGAAAGGTFATNGTYTVSDATGTSTLFIPSVTSASAVNAFAGQTIPAGTVNITGYVDYYATGAIIEFYPTAIQSVVAAPEPATLAAFGAIGGLAMIRRRARKA